MTTGIQSSLMNWNEWMHIQPSENLVNTPETRLSSDSQYRRIAETEAVVNELGDRFAAYTEKVLQMAEFDGEGVHSAKAILDSESLETPQTLQAAAESILFLGI